jgi:uncharacterized membrane protein
MDPFNERLPGVLQEWQQARLISTRQMQAILAHTGLADTGLGEAPRTVNPWVVTLAVLGALVLGLGMIALVGSNWATVPDGLKLAGVLLLMLGAYTLGYRLRDHTAGRLPILGAALYLLGAVLYGALLALLSQGLNLDLDVTSLLMLWGLGVLVLAYAASLPAALHLALPLGIVIPLSGLYGGGAWLYGSSLETICGIVGGCGVLMLLATVAHKWGEVGRSLSNPWAFWGPLLLLGSLYTLYVQHLSETFSGWGLMWLLLLLAASLVLTWWGHRQQRRAWVNWGLLFVGLSVLTIYFQLFGTLATTGGVLVGAGLLLLLVAWGLERTRRQLSGPGQRA